MKIVVTGPQRSGTRIAAQIISKELELTYIDELEFDVHNESKFLTILLEKDNFVIQAPGMSHVCHLINDTFDVVFCYRDIEAILRSEDRIGWRDGIDENEVEREKYRDERLLSEYSNYENACEMKYAAWENVQKPIIKNWYEIKFDSLKSHSLFKEERKSFKWNQTEVIESRKAKLPKDRIRVFCHISTDGACGYYRLRLPYERIKSNCDDIDVIVCTGWNRHLFEYIETADIAVFERLSGPAIDKLIDLRDRTGMKIIVDYDDNLFEINPLSQHYKDWGTKNVQFEQDDGQIITIWEDGQNNYSIRKNRERLGYVEKSIKEADYISCTTPLLAETFMSIGAKKTLVFKNCVDLKVWQKIPAFIHSGDFTRLIWSGGASHYHDFYLIHDVLKDLMNDHKDIMLIIFGTEFKGLTKDLPQDRVFIQPWVPTPSYPYVMARLQPDIGLIPLNDDVFNHNKSQIKIVEYGSLGIPSVVSMFSPYTYFPEDCGVFIENNDKDAWYKGIYELYNDAVLGLGVGRKAEKEVYKNYDIDKEYIHLADFLRSIGR